MIAPGLFLARLKFSFMSRSMLSWIFLMKEMSSLVAQKLAGSPDPKMRVTLGSSDSMRLCAAMLSDKARASDNVATEDGRTRSAIVRVLDAVLPAATSLS